MTKEEFLNFKKQNLTNKEIGKKFNLTERQVSIRTKAWGLNYSNKKALNEQFFSSITKAAFYWAGFIAADGWIEPDRDRLGLALQSADIGHLIKFKTAIAAEHEICPFMSGSAYRIRFNSAKIVRDLNSLFNITGAKTFTYRMPYFEDDYLMYEFFRGYIEGDGHLEKTSSGKVVLHLCSANKSFLEEFKSICELMLNRSISQLVTLQINKKGSVYAIRFNIKDSFELITLLYKNSTEETRLDRKYKIASLVLDKGIVH